MKHFKHLLFLSILCSIVLFTNCGDSDDPVAVEEVEEKFTLTVLISPTEGGSVSYQSGPFTEGTKVTLIATANENYAFKEWTGAFNGTNNSMELIMSADNSVTAVFELLDADSDGVTDADDTCAFTAEGAEVDENGCEIIRYIYRDQNGVTIKATEDAVIGEEYTLLGENYLIVDKTMLREMIVENEDVSKVVTTFITNMDDLFGGGEYFEPYNDVQLDFQRDSIGFYEDTLNGVFGRYTGKYEYAAKNFDYDISGWDVSKVTSMVKMFAGMSTIAGDAHDFTNWDVCNVTTMKGLFKNSKIYGGNFSGWDICNVEDLSELFMNVNVNSGGYIGVSNWNTSNVKNMRRAIYGDFCYLDWDFSSVENMSQMFKRSGGGSALNYLAEWDVSNVKNMSGMFDQAGNFNANIGNWDVSNVEDMSYMFKRSEQFSRDISDWDVSNVKNMREMFCKTQYKRSIDNWNVINVIDCKDFSFREDTISSSFVDNIYWKPNFTNCTE